jgi:hypothetical protein
MPNNTFAPPSMEVARVLLVMASMPQQLKYQFLSIQPNMTMSFCDLVDSIFHNKSDLHIRTRYRQDQV